MKKFFVLFLLLPFICFSSEMQTQDFEIDALDKGIKLHVVNKKLKGSNPGRAVIFVHGSGSPGSCFDVDLPGGSWLYNAAMQGYSAYTFDIRGYGGSTRPDSMFTDPSENPPFAFTADAVRDLSAVVDFVMKKEGVKKVSIVGWSWGGTIAAQYTAGNNDRVDKLALYAPLYLLDKPRKDTDTSYRVITYAGSSKARLNGIPEGREDVSPIEWYDIVWKRNLESDPYGSKLDPPGFRAPNGTIRDAYTYWSNGKKTYEPSKITVPTLIILGEWDQATPVNTALKLFNDLVNVPYKKLVILPEMTHSAIHEKNRMYLIEEVNRFLEG